MNLKDFWKNDTNLTKIDGVIIVVVGYLIIELIKYVWKNKEEIWIKIESEHVIILFVIIYIIVFYMFFKSPIVTKNPREICYKKFQQKGDDVEEEVE